MEHHNVKRKRLTRNFYIYFASDAFNFTALMFMKDAIIQTFLSHFGVSDHLIGIYSTILNIINVSVLLLSPVVSSRAQTSVSAMVRLTVPIGI